MSSRNQDNKGNQSRKRKERSKVSRNRKRVKNHPRKRKKKHPNPRPKVPPIITTRKISKRSNSTCINKIGHTIS